MRVKGLILKLEFSIDRSTYLHCTLKTIIIGRVSFNGGHGGVFAPPWLWLAPLNERLNETLFVCACLYIVLPRCNLIVSVQYRYKLTPVLYNTGVNGNTGVYRYKLTIQV